MTTYKEAGVDIDAADNAVENRASRHRCKNIPRRCRPRRGRAPRSEPRPMHGGCRVFSPPLSTPCTFHHSDKKTPAAIQPARRHARMAIDLRRPFQTGWRRMHAPPLETHETCVFLGDSDHMSLRGGIRLLPWLPATNQRIHACPLAASQ